MALPVTDMRKFPSKYDTVSDTSLDNTVNIDYGSSFDTQYFPRESIDEIYIKA